jgi:hypothetical protein
MLGRVAIVAVHGVADRKPGASAQSIVRLLGGLHAVIGALEAYLKGGGFVFVACLMLELEDLQVAVSGDERKIRKVCQSGER